MKIILLLFCALVCSSNASEAPQENNNWPAVGDILSFFLQSKHVPKDQLDIFQTIKCTYTEITVPAAAKIRSIGAFNFGKYLLNDAFKTFVIETNLISAPFQEIDTENILLKTRFDRCMGVENPQTVDSPVDVAEGRSKGYGKKKDYSSLGFALLGLKVVGALAAFLAWDLMTM